MKGRCISEWLTWSRRLFSPQGGEGLAVINGISCAPSRTGAVPCCGDLLEENSFAADRDGAGVSPNRAHRGKAKIKAKLLGDCELDEWDLPPKPKGMRWATYDRYVE